MHGRRRSLHKESVMVVNTARRGLGEIGPACRGEQTVSVSGRLVLIAVIAFLTLIDLFGSQALLPRLVEEYGADPAVMGFAVNASTLGMAASGLTVAWFADRIDRKRGIWLSLSLLAIPTTLLAFTKDTTLFAVLRIAQGVFMAAAFTLTMTYIAETMSRRAAAGAMAAYITGNVASNLFGRLMAASLADVVGISGSFLGFAALNLAGGYIAYRYLVPAMPPAPACASPLAAWKHHLSAPRMRAAFAIGFIILFVFVGTFTYVNLELVGPRLGLDDAYLGLVYLVFLPSLVTTAFAGTLAHRLGARRLFLLATAGTLVGFAMLLPPSLPLVLAGLAVVGMGTFFAQAAVTGYVGRAAEADVAAANGLYLTSYYLGGLVGALVVGEVYTAFGWGPTVVGLGAMMALAGAAAFALTEKT